MCVCVELVGCSPTDCAKFSLVPPQCGAEIRSPEAELGSRCAVGVSFGTGGGEPAEFTLPQTGGQPLPVGVPVPSEHHSHRAQLHGTAEEHHRLPGCVHDRHRAVLCSAHHLRCHGDVPCGTTAVSAWQSVPRHLRLFRRLCPLPAYSGGCAGARLADLLQQEAPECLVHQHTGQEEEMKRVTKIDRQFHHHHHHHHVLQG